MAFIALYLILTSYYFLKIPNGKGIWLKVQWHHIMWVRHRNRQLLTHKEVGVVGVGGEVCQVDKVIQKEADACLKVQCLLGKVLQCIYQQPTLKLEHCTNKHPRGPVLRKTGNHLLPPNLYTWWLFVIVFGIYGDPSSCVFNILNNETIPPERSMSCHFFI